jgi:nucleoside-diphosphate-sugar epimerase
LPLAASVVDDFMSLLLTGATGFLGRNIVLRALGEEREIFAPVRSPGKLIQQLQFENKDLHGVHILSAVPEQWPKISPRCAILGGAVLFERTRSDYFRINVDWTLAILRALPQECPTVVISSQSAGGPTPSGKASRTEADSDAPITWYESKLAMEEAIRREFPNRPITILRPPMILGPRDAATLPLFRMARGCVRIKPGLRAKSYSFLAVEDLVTAVFLALENEPPAQSFYVASTRPVTDWQLIASAATACNSRGLTLPVPHLLVRILSRVIDATPALRAQAPSLTRDRAREIWADRWIVDGSKFEQLTGWRAITDLRDAMQAAHNYYVREGKL